MSNKNIKPLSFFVKIGVAETTNEVCDYLYANNFKFINEYINQRNFPLTAKKCPKEDEIVIYDPGTNFTQKEGLAILQREGLLRPTYEHALRFAREHGTATTSKEKPFIVFLHQSWPFKESREIANYYRRICYRRVICIDRHPDHHTLRLDHPNGEYLKREGGYVLAGVRPRRE